SKLRTLLCPCPPAPTMPMFTLSLGAVYPLPPRTYLGSITKPPTAAVVFRINRRRPEEGVSGFFITLSFKSKFKIRNYFKNEDVCCLKHRGRIKDILGE